MSAEKLTSELAEAREMLAEINEQLEKISHWSTDNAAGALGKLQDKWEKACLDAVSTQSPEFQGRCEDLLADSEVLQTHIVEQAQYFTNTAEDRLSALELLAGNDKDMQDLTKQVFERWNGTVKPQLTCLYEKSEQLEKSILDMMQF